MTRIRRAPSLWQRVVCWATGHVWEASFSVREPWSSLCQRCGRNALECYEPGEHL